MIKLGLVALFLLPLCVRAQGLPAGKEPLDEADALDEALVLYRHGALEQADSLLDRLAREPSADADALAWLAETKRRLGRPDLAVEAARSAVRLSPCNAIALTTLGDAFNPQYGHWEGVSYDSTWAYLQRATACDPDDGNAWLGVWKEALRRGLVDQEREALERLVSSGFLTPTLLAYNRWVLRSLPERAVLITNGDWDTFPALALQVTEGLRPDITVVNFPMLNLWWYAELQGKETGFGLPLTQAEAENLEPVLSEDSTRYVWLADAVLAGWRQNLVEGEGTRPFVLAWTVAEPIRETGPGVFSFVGPGWLLVPRAAAHGADLDRIAASLGRLDPTDFLGPEVSVGDRSPLRHANVRGLTSGLVYTGLQYAYYLQQNKEHQRARQAIVWSRRFAEDVGLIDELGAEIDYFEAELLSTK